MTALPEIPETFDVTRDLLAVRDLAAPLSRLWAAWTDPVQLPLWWGPKGFRCETLEIDLRPGGQWRFTMIGPDGTRYANRIRYPAMIPMERIDYVIDDDGAGHICFGARARFSATLTGSRVEMHSRFDSPATLVAMERLRARDGLASTLACLADFLDGA